MSQSNGSSNALTSRLVSYIGYQVSGLLLVTVNGLIVLTMLSYKQLRTRKEYFFKLALALADMFNGLGFIFAGSWRTQLILTDQYQVLKTARQCMMTPFNLIWIWAEPASYTMLVCISVDRIFAVNMPMRYYKFKIAYAYKLVSIFWGWALVTAVGSLLFSFLEPQDAVYGSFCFTGWAVGKFYVMYYRNLAVPCGVASVLLYFSVPFLYRHRKAKVQITNHNQEADASLQRRVTITMGISVMCTAIFFLFPKMLYSGLQYFYGGRIPPSLENYITPPLFLISNVNPLCNFVLYVWRHDKFRTALIHFLKCKALPPNFHAIRG